MTSYRDPLKGTWDRHRDPLKGTWNQTQRPTQRNMGRRHPDSDIIQRPAQRNMGPDTETHSKEHGTRHRDLLRTCDRHRDPLKGTWDQTVTETRSKEHGTRHQRPSQRNMEPYTETHSKEHGTRHRDPLKGT